MMEIKFSVPGTPVAKARARTFLDSRTGQYRSITPKKTASYEGDIKRFYQYETEGYTFQPGMPLAVEITARFVPVKSESKKRRNLMLCGLLFHTKKPDIDNIVKSVMDALNGVAWHDDAQVVSILARKEYDENAGLDVAIKSL